MRVIAWFSCGAASAVAAKLAVEKYGGACEVVYCDTLVSEHPDNARFMDNIARWLGREIHVIRSEKYASIDDVFTARRYLAGIAGAPCTVEMKQVPRKAHQEADDIHIFGYTVDEIPRIDRFVLNNPELYLDWILRDRMIDKNQCYRILEDAGIELPAMYRLGFRNNNCVGCVKASSPVYWARVRQHFPETFARRAAQSREYGARLVKIDDERRFLDELPADDALPLFGGRKRMFRAGRNVGIKGRDSYGPLTARSQAARAGCVGDDGSDRSRGGGIAMQFEMPTPCTECGEIFDLHDGRCNPRGGNNVVCSECADKADEEIERIDEIMALWSEIEEAKFTIKAAKGRLRELGINPEAPNEI